MDKINCILLADENVSNTFLVYKLLRKLNLSDSIHIVRGGTNALSFVQDFARANNNACPELIIINSKIVKSDGSLFLDLICQNTFANKHNVKILVTGKLAEPIEHKDVILLEEPVTKENLLKAIGNLGFKTFAA